MLKGILNRTTLVGLVLILVLGTTLLGACTKEKIVEVPVEKIVEREVIKEVPVTPPKPVSYTIADPTGDWGYPSPYLRYSRGPGYVRMSFVFDTLVWKDENGLIPALAKEWEYVVADNAYIFNLQENVTWHDGERFTAQDVAFTIDYVKNHPDPFVTLIGPSGITQVEVIDDHTVKLYLETTYAPFLNDIAGTMAILPKHIWETVDDPMSFDGPEAVIGTGPYKLADYSKEHGTYLYEAYENYYSGKPEIDKLKFVKVSEQMVPAALKDGSIDAGGIPPELVGEVEEKGFTVIQAPCGWNAKLTINHTKEPLSIGEFRQALAYAIDRESLVAITQRGHATPGSAGTMPPDSKWYNPNIEQYNYDPDKAQGILKDLGYELDGDFFVKDGQALELELLTQKKYGFGDVGEFIKQQLESVGIKVDLRMLEGKSLDARVGAWEFDLSVYGHGGLYEPSILPKVITGQGFNSARYTENETLNQLLDAQLHEMDTAKRLEMVQEVQAVYAEEVPALTLYYPNWFWAHNNRAGIFELLSNVVEIPSQHSFR